MIGHTLGGRYEVIEEIGGGGMALVYNARDVLLNRHVAIKVLRQQFVYDEEFIRRFRREAQSAASLSHPNVVSIYDVGQEGDIHYIVMEYVQGYNLNEVIKERAPLPVDEAIRIASQICDALDHAHHNQIIHRDIKPHNILIGRNGRVKVTDFGIARAVTSTTITQTGSVVGSVHYFSPEHAKGVATGEKSDLYSLGIVLYQMLTGRLPFLGESPISVALKHLQDEFEEPRLINPLIPQSVENIILKSMRKNPSERYNSAHEMLQDLDTCLLPERRSETKVYFPTIDDDEQTRVISAIRPTSIPVGDDDRKSDREMSRSSAPSKQQRKWVKPTIWISAVVVLLALMTIATMYIRSTLDVPDVAVPNLINQTQDNAKKLVDAQGLDIGQVTSEYKEGQPAGIVIAQSKDAGSMVKEGALIDITVTAEKELSKMPDLNAKTYEDARKLLLAEGFKEDQITRMDENNDNVDSGTVFDQTPGANADVDPATTTVTVTVSKGTATASVPDLTGMSQSDAQSKLSSNGFAVGDVGQETSYTVANGKVTRQNPASGNSLSKGSKVSFWVSSGYPPEAFDFTYSVSIPPATAGKSSKINIKYTDATGENKDWGTKTINSRQSLKVNMILGPNRDGAVSIYRDGEFIDTYAIGYNEAKQGSVQETVVEPDAPVEVPPVDNGGSTGTGTGTDDPAVDPPTDGQGTTPTDPATDGTTTTDPTTEEGTADSGDTSTP